MKPGDASRASSSRPKTDGLTQRTLQFVNTTGSVTLDEASRMEIRAQVMRDWHRRKKQHSVSNDPTTRGAHGSDASCAAIATSTHRFKLSARSLLPKPPISSRPGSRSKDIKSAECEQEHDLPLELPENVFEVAVTAPQDGLALHTAATAENLESTAETLQSRYAKATGHKWLFNLESYLQTDTLNNVPSSGQLDPFGAMSLLITPLNDCLKSAWLLIPVRKAYFSVTIHDEAFLHTCLAYIVGRYSARFQSGDPIESLQHRMEAIRILNERMGDPIQSLTDGSFGAVANLAFMRADLNTASVMSKRPSFPFIDHWPTQTAKGGATILQEIPSAPTITFDQLAATSSLKSLLVTLRSLTWSLEQIYTHNAVHQHDIRTSDSLYYSQARLYALCCRSYRAREPLTTATTAAMLIYSHKCLRDTSFTFRNMAVLVRNLKTELLQIPEEVLLACDHRERFLWVLATGAMAAEGKEERAWLVAAFERAVDAMGLRSWVEAERASCG